VGQLLIGLLHMTCTSDATVAGSKYSFSTQSVGGTWGWSVKADNTLGIGQLFQFVDITTPYGPLFQVEIPIPGDVIQEMAGSLFEVQSQLAPLMALIQPAVPFNIIIVEGDPNRAVGSVEVKNIGAFGSFMQATATPDSAWLSADPSIVQGIGKNQTAGFNVSLLTATLLASGSPFNGNVNLQDNRNPPTIIPIPVTVTVFPRPVIGTSPAQLSFTYIVSTGVPSGALAITVENTGPLQSSLEFTAAVVNGSAWLALVPTSGGPLDPGQTAQITASLNISRVPLGPGVYSDFIRISSGTASNSPVDIPVTLTVQS
jgi:hypothetical protein